jgi:hypothetical protein
MTQKDESGLKSALMKVVKQRLLTLVALRHEDVRTAGIPDLSLTGFGHTTWWEFKHGTPDFTSSGIQELTMLRLAAVGYARYVIWEEGRGIKRTMIVHPKHLSDLVATAWCTGFNHQWIVEQMRIVHRA